MSDLGRIVRLINDARRILITSHKNPDPDALGSMLGLGLSIQNIGKEVVFFNSDGVPEHYGFLPGSEQIRKSLYNITEDFDCTFVVDCASMDRVGDQFEKFKQSGNCGTTVIIDHHEVSYRTADLYLLNKKSSSTGMIVYFLLNTLSIEITPDVAKNLYATITSDTGSFRYLNTGPETFRIAADLVERGANPGEISQSLYENDSPKRLRLLGKVLSTFDMTEDGLVAWVIVNKRILKATGTTKSETDGMVNFPRSVRGVEVAILFREESDEGSPKWKVSLRSKGKVNVASVAQKFGGGGHKNAAGCTIHSDLPEVKRKVLNCFKQVTK